jgi:hypothetical protein
MSNNSDLLRDLKDFRNQLLGTSNDFDYIVHSDLASVTPTQNPDLVRLKSKINDFFQQHPEILNNIKKHPVCDDCILYVLKRIFDPSFTTDDVIQTNHLMKKFVNKHKERIKIIIDYFFDDLKPLIWNRMCPYLKLLYPCIDLVPRLVLREAVIYYLEKSGISVLTSFMYPNQTDLVENQNKTLVTQSTSHKNKSFLLMLFYIMVCIISGSEIFRFMFYHFVGLICTKSVLYVFRDL